jgi:hypothetical protein
MLDGFSGDSGTGYFGVYDGHGGRNVAEFLRLHLHVNVENELKLKGDRSVEECLRAAFLYTDVMCHGTGEQASGSTAVVCIVRRDDTNTRYVYTANCGDARAVLCHRGSAVRLSKVSVCVCLCVLLNGWMCIAPLYHTPSTLRDEKRERSLPQYLLPPTSPYSSLLYPVFHFPSYFSTNPCRTTRPRT